MLGGDVVFRTVGDNTIVARPPVKSGDPTEAQLQHQDRFRRASIYSKAVLADPEKAATYGDLHPDADSGTPYIRALKDYLKGPEIPAVEVAAYSGQPGDLIFITALDDTKVVDVNVQIMIAGEEIVEQGQAQELGNGLDYTYTAQTLNEPVAGTTIRVIATDIPGNKTIREITLA